MCGGLFFPNLSDLERRGLMLKRLNVSRKMHTGGLPDAIDRALTKYLNEIGISPDTVIADVSSGGGKVIPVGKTVLFDRNFLSDLMKVYIRFGDAPVDVVLCKLRAADGTAAGNEDLFLRLQGEKNLSENDDSRSQRIANRRRAQGMIDSLTLNRAEHPVEDSVTDESVSLAPDPVALPPEKKGRGAYNDPDRLGVFLIELQTALSPTADITEENVSDILPVIKAHYDLEPGKAGPIFRMLVNERKCLAESCPPDASGGKRYRFFWKRIREFIENPEQYRYREPRQPTPDVSSPSGISEEVPLPNAETVSEDAPPPTDMVSRAERKLETLEAEIAAAQRKADAIAVNIQAAAASLRDLQAEHAAIREVCEGLDAKADRYRTVLAAAREVQQTLADLDR